MCATSIGSTFSHRPVPGERKSGMPLGTEMPAPVSATVRLEERSSSARRSMLIEYAAPPRAVESRAARLRRSLTSP